MRRQLPETLSACYHRLALCIMTSNLVRSSICRIFGAFICAVNFLGNIFFNLSRIKITNFVKSSNESLSLDPANAFLRKLTYNLLHGKYPNQIHVQTKTNEKHQQYLLLQKISSKTDVENIEKMRRNSQLVRKKNPNTFPELVLFRFSRVKFKMQLVLPKLFNYCVNL